MLRPMLKAAALGLAVSLLVVAHVLSRHSAHPAALLQAGGPVLRSASYYQALAAADGAASGRVALRSAGGLARTQILSGKWDHGALAGKASLVTMCAKGDNAACDKLAADPNAIASLQSIDQGNPQGFAAHHPRKFRSLRQEEDKRRPVEHRQAHGQTKADRLAAHQLEMYRASHRPLPRSLRSYHTSEDTRREWKSTAWKGGALRNKATGRWLRACGKGNFYACKHIASSNDDLDTLIEGHKSRVIVQ
ncbi:hypothetical protein T484DRAFT_1742010, partial [Baffinella frigidus]